MYKTTKKVHTVSEQNVEEICSSRYVKYGARSNEEISP